MKINGSIWAGRALLAAFLLSFLMGSAQQPVSRRFLPTDGIKE